MQHNSFNSEKRNNSVILSAIASFFSKVSSVIKNSFIYSCFCNYSLYENKYKQSATARMISKFSLLKHKLLNFRIKCAKFAEKSLILHFFDKIITTLFMTNLRSIGIFLFAFGGFIFTANFSGNLKNMNYFNFSESLIFGALLLIISFFFLPSAKKSLACIIRDNRLFSYLFVDLFSLKHINSETCSKVLPTSGLSFFLGLMFGSISYFTSPRLTLFVFSLIAVIYLILTRPENGILFLCLFLPFLTTKVLTFLIIITLASEIFKIARGKRSAHFNLCSGALFVIGLILLSTSLISFDKAGAFKSISHIYMSIVLAIFIIMIINSSTLAHKCLGLLTVSCLASSVYGIYYFLIQYLKTGNIYNTFTYISTGGLYPFFNEAKYFAAFLIAAIPLLFLNKERSSKIISILSLTIAMGCLVITNTYHALTALIISLVFLMIVYSKFGLWLIGVIITAIYLLKRLSPNLYEGSIEKYLLAYSKNMKGPVDVTSESITNFFAKIWSFGIGQGDNAQVVSSALTENTTPYYSGFGETYINMFIHLGVPLTVLSLIIISIFIIRILSTSLSKNVSLSTKQFSAALVSSLIALVVYAFYINIFADFKTTLLLFLILSLGSALADSSDNDYISFEIERDNLYE